MMKLKEIASTIEGTLFGDGETDIEGIASMGEARKGDITFLLNRSFEKYLADCRASAVIVGEETAEALLAGRNFIRVKVPGLAYIEAARLFEAVFEPVRGVSPGAHVSPRAMVSSEASIFPFVYVDEGAVVARHAVIYPFCFIGREVRIGEDTVIHSHVSVYERTVIGKRVIVHAGVVLGADGFGYIWDGGKHRKIPQLGMLEIGDDVEIGANTCIDRASLDKTVIGRGTKIDNLAQIGHNVSVGENSIIVSQVGIAGSTTVGKNVVLGGKVGVADHVTIGDGVRAAGGTGITKDVKENSLISGTPHMAHREWLRLQAYLKKLPELFDRMGKIEKELSRGTEHDRD